MLQDILITPQEVADELVAEAAHRLNVTEDLAKVAEQRLESLTR